MARQTAINSADDMRWLREVHLPRLPAKYKSAIIVGNEDYPDRIEVYERKDPRVTDVSIIFEADDEGVFKEKPSSASRHHATKKKSPAQLDREIAEVLGSWEEDPFGGYRFITTNEGVRFDTADVDPTYYRDPKWRQRWEFDLKREIEKFKAGKPTKLYKMSETHYRLPGTV